MTRALALLVGAAVSLTGIAASVAGAAPAPARAVESGAKFPERAFVLTLPEKRLLRANDVNVTENGDPVKALSVTPASLGSESAVVLVIDTSVSMRGAPIQDAFRAARALASHRSGRQRLAVVTFDKTARVILPFTTDQAAIDDVLAEVPQLSLGTHVYDGVRLATELVTGPNGGLGSIVVLSDGADTGSRSSVEGVTRAAVAAHSRIFTVGLRSAEFSATPLRRMAEGTGAAYAEASTSSQLEQIYDALGARLASEHVLRYTSFVGDDTRVRVRIRVDDVPGVVTAGYKTPALPTAVTPPFERSVSQRLWESPLLMLAIALAVAGLLAAAVIRALRPRGKSVVDRLSEFVSLVSNQPEARGPGTPITETVFNSAERSLEKVSGWPRFKEELEIAEIRFPPVQLVLWTLVATAFSMWLFWVAVGPLAALVGLVVPFGVRSFVRRRLSRKRRLFGDQLPDNLQVLASALRAGHSLVGALSVVIDDAPEPSRSEFQRVIADEQLGVPLDEALQVVARRMDNRDLEQVALVAALQRRTGANSAEVLDRVTENVRESQGLRRLIRSLTAQGRMSRWVVSVLPVGLLFLITVLNPDYIEPLYTNAVGRVLLAMAAIMVVSGSLVIRKIVDIKV